MNLPVEADIISMLRNLVNALQPFSNAHSVRLNFKANYKELIITYYPEEIIADVTRLICSIVSYTPHNHAVLLSAEWVDDPEADLIKIRVENTGINLTRVGNITEGCKYPVFIYSDGEQSTSFELQWSSKIKNTEASLDISKVVGKDSKSLPHFYLEMRKRLRSYFNKSENLVSLLSEHHPKDAIFLQKVNALILSNIEKEGFNANDLSTSMYMSRTQLYRKLQPLIRQSPGCYIKSMRLQKAKELLETTDLNIGEVAFKTGFQTQSHFCRVFIQHFGVQPSLFRRKNKG